MAFPGLDDLDKLWSRQPKEEEKKAESKRVEVYRQCHELLSCILLATTFWWHYQNVVNNQDDYGLRLVSRFVVSAIQRNNVLICSFRVTRECRLHKAKV